MRPDKPRLSKGELAVLSGGLGLLFWATALVALSPNAHGEQLNTPPSQSRAEGERCNPLQPGSCPPGHVCDNGGGGTSTCSRACDYTALDSCGKGWIWESQPPLEP